MAIGMIPQTKIVEELVELENGYIKPTQREKTDLVGLEFELPIVRLCRLHSTELTWPD